ncbi:MAG: adenine methyltransferase [Anaerolinea sp.]|nr:adenine methyltransferase [Anaerolinea sp.]
MATDSFWQAAFSSTTGQWNTPPELVAEMRPVFTWDADVCADEANVCTLFYSPDEDGLAQTWRGLCWMNPPYGRAIGSWTQKAAASSQATVVALLPARTETAWWQDTVCTASQVVFIRGRLAFGSNAYWQWRWETQVIDGKKNNLYGRHGQKQSAPFPSAFVVWGNLSKLKRDFLSSYGLTMEGA